MTPIPDRPRNALPAFAVTLSLVASAAGQGITIHDLPELARARSERQRPAQEAALEPFWPDLRMDYDRNRELLEERFVTIAKLGDSVVPLLLEKLRPADDGNEARSLAGNCARVLRQLEPASFADALLDYLGGPSKTAQQHSIWLLGFTRSTRAAKGLREVFPRLESSGRRTAAAALTELGDREAAPLVTGMLTGDDGSDRKAALGYLVEVAPDDVFDQVLDALQSEKANELLPRYIAYFGRVGRRSAPLAAALLPLLDGDRLDPNDTLELIRVLGIVAPEGHEPTTRRLEEMLQGQIGTRGRALAKALFELGDKKGYGVLKDAVDEAIRNRRNEGQHYLERAELYFALENWRAAATDFDRAAKLSGRLRRRANLRIASCEAHLGRWPKVLQHLRDSNATPKEIREAADQDEGLRQALENDIVRRWFNSIAEDDGKDD